MNRPPTTLHPEAAPTRPAPRYPTRADWRAGSREGWSPVIALGGAISSAALAGCTALWPVLAPIFEHGDGVGAFGCLVVAAPYFLSEEEAAEIVRQELAANGYGGLGTPPACGAFTLDQLVVRGMCGPDDWEALDGAVVGDRFDLCGGEADLSIEIVTSSDYDRLVYERAGGCSVWSRSLRDLADYVALQAVAGAPNGWVAVFYDPVASEYPRYDSGEDTAPGAYDQAEQDLRAQVRDFVDWLAVRGR